VIVPIYQQFSHDGLLHKIIEGRMIGKPTRGRRRLQMLCNLTSEQLKVISWRYLENIAQ